MEKILEEEMFNIWVTKKELLDKEWREQLEKYKEILPALLKGHITIR